MYENIPHSSTRSHSVRNLHRLILVSFGLLCVLQAALNISLRLVLYRANNKTEGVEVISTNTTGPLKSINYDQYFQAWILFQQSLYYISFEKKRWQSSRDFCVQRGANLVVVNSKEEQDFISRFPRPAWIGLREKEMKWTWVDGTPLTKSFWRTGEPNNYEGTKEDCVEINIDTKNNWNDAQCDYENFWICEKPLAP